MLVVLERETVTLPGGVGRSAVAIAIVASAIAIGTFLFRVLGSPRPNAFSIAANVVGPLFFVCLIWLVLFAVWIRAWVPRELRVDGRGQELFVAFWNLFSGKERNRIVRLSELAGIKIEGIVRGPIRVTFQIGSGSERPRELRLSLAVDGIDKLEETLDLAYRMGAAAGLTQQRVLRKDPRQVEIELRRTSGAGFTSAPSVTTPADYARDQVIPEATTAARKEVIPPFDPAYFQSDYKVTQWVPRQEVRFRKPLSLTGFAGLLCLPVAAAGLLGGPALLVVYGSHPTPDIPHPVAAALVLGLFGLCFGAFALTSLYRALPRWVAIDWSNASIRIGGWFGREEIAFSSLVHLELRCLHRHTPASDDDFARDWYWCELNAHLRDGLGGNPGPMLLIKTREFRDDSSPAYRQALPLATELAAALGVSRRVVGQM